MPDRREQRGDRTAQALLEAARDAFAQSGFAGASVRDIARRAGVNAALVRYHYGSKLKLYKAVVAETIGGVQMQIGAALVHGAGTVEARVSHMVEVYVDYCAANPEFPRLVARGMLDRDREIIEPVARGLRTLFELMERYMRLRGARLVAVDELATSLFAAAVMPFVYTPVLAEARGTDPLSAEAVGRRRAHLRGLVEVLLSHVELVEPRSD